MSFGHYTFGAFKFGAAASAATQQAFDISDLIDSRTSARTVMALPSDGVIGDPLQATSIPLETPAITGGRWLGDSWSLVDANGTTLTDAAISAEDSGTNLFLNPTAPATQNITVEAIEYTLSITGTGDITLSGVGSGTATDGSNLTFTPTSGTLTCTVNGTVDSAQLEVGGIETSFMDGTRAYDNYTYPTPSFWNTSRGALELTYIPRDEDGGQLIECGDVDVTVTPTSITFVDAELTTNFVVDTPYAIKIFWIAGFVGVGVDGVYDIGTGTINILSDTLRLANRGVSDAGWIDSNGDVWSDSAGNFWEDAMSEATNITAGEFPVGDIIFHRSPTSAGWISLTTTLNPDGTQAYNPDGSVMYNLPTIL